MTNTEAMTTFRVGLYTHSEPDAADTQHVHGAQLAGISRRVEMNLLSVQRKTPTQSRP